MYLKDSFKKLNNMSQFYKKFHDNLKFIRFKLNFMFFSAKDKCI